MPLAPLIALTVFLASCCVVDVRTRRVPNAISAPGIVTGVLLNWLYFGTPGIVTSALGIAVMVALLFVPFALGGIGGGDVKMMAAVGALIGPRLALLGAAVGMGLGGVVMTVHLIRLGRLAEKIDALRTMFSSAVTTRSVAPLRVASDDPRAISLPYSVPLGIGTAVAIVAAAKLGL